QASGQQDHLEHHETRSAEQAEIPGAVDEVGHEVYDVAFLLAGDVDGGLTGRTDTEGERTGDRVRVGGDHPPAHDIGAVVDLGGQFGDHLLVQRANHDVDVGTGGVEDAHAVVDQVDRFAERQRHLAGRVGHDRPVRRIGGFQLRMRGRGRVT